jgi:hypothetical protein
MPSIDAVLAWCTAELAASRITAATARATVASVRAAIASVRTAHDLDEMRELRELVVRAERAAEKRRANEIESRTLDGEAAAGLVMITERPRPQEN